MNSLTLLIFLLSLICFVAPLEVNSTDPPASTTKSGNLDGGRICIKCLVGDENCTTLRDQSKLENCTTKDQNVCYTKTDEKGLNERGCTSNPEEVDECNKDKKNCKTCNEKTNCNDKIYPENRSKCYQCEGFYCGANFNDSDIGYCTKVTDECFSFKNTISLTATRNCAAKQTAEQDCKTENESCEKCKEDLCNKKKYELDFKCYRCRTDNPNESKCATTGINLMPCNTYSKNSTTVNECYSERLNGHVYRGCVLDMPAEGKMRCLNEHKGCYVCPEPGCNSGPAPNSANTSHLFSITITIYCLIFLQYQIKNLI